jgi:beta-lactamase superfamily II metal-dependent hydrolase
MRYTIATVLVLLVAAVSVSAAKTLDIYFIDVEGGQSTLIVTPAGQTLLIDTGYPERDGRDPDRIMAAVRDAHVTRIDYLLITHFHEDHDGGAAELARRIPIGTFVDYGSPLETGSDVVAAFTAYEGARRQGRHLVPNPGDRLPLEDLDVEVVSAAGAMLSKPLSGGGHTNAACAAFEPRIGGGMENPRSIGVRVRLGAFRFLDLGDLGWNKLGELACPNNLLGEADVYLVAHHGNGDANVPALLAALRPRVAVVNNGPYKGGTAGALATLRGLADIEGVWQLHRSLYQNVDNNSPDAFIANLDVDDNDGAAWIKLSASEDGSFSVANGRTGWTQVYDAR